MEAKRQTFSGFFFGKRCALCIFGKYSIHSLYDEIATPPVTFDERFLAKRSMAT
jgi:hypothetical protein